MAEQQVQKTVEKIELTAQILLRSFTDEETKKELDYVSVELPDPFGDEDFVDVAITPKWQNDEVMFKFYAKKALRKTDKVEFPVTIKALSYTAKDKKVITYPGIVGINPFSGRELEFRVKGKSKDDKNVVIFKNLARELLGLTPEDEDIGLM